MRQNMSELQNINDKPYRDYVRIYCDDDRKDELIEALDLIWEHPEGRKKIGESYANKGTLDIIYDKEEVKTGYGTPTIEGLQSLDFDNITEPLDLCHKIIIAPYGYKLFETEQGEIFEASLVNELAHELEHAANLNSNNLESIAFINRFNHMSQTSQQDRQIEQAKLIAEIIPENFNEIDLEEKFNIFNTKCNEPDFAQRWQNIVDNSLELQRKEMRENQKFASYIQKIETPAIDFANEIVDFVNTKRDFQEPMRRNDYTDSIMKSPDFQSNLSEYHIYAIMGEAEQIMGNKGLENHINIIKENYKPFIEEFYAGALVRIDDTPQAQVAQIEQIGKMLEQNKQRQI